MNILGISCYYHDAAACLIRDGKVVAAAQEERFTRKRHDPEFPQRAVQYCLRQAGLTVKDIDYVGFYDKPLIKFERLLQTYLAVWPKGWESFRIAMPDWLKRKIRIPQVIRQELGYDGEVLMIEHHLAHAASTFFCSPFSEAAVLTVDGVGEWATTTCGTGEGNDLRIMQEIDFPHSLGLLYSAFTYYLGFKVNSAEYKVMGLAPYGKPVYYDKIMGNLIKVAADGSYWMDQSYFAYTHGLVMTTPKFHDLFGAPPVPPETRPTQREMDLAASLQQVTDEIMLKLARGLRASSGKPNLCLAGGVALNCVANAKILEAKIFDNIFIKPAAGDAGGALGVALYIDHALLRTARGPGLNDVYFGPEFADDEIEAYLTKNQIAYTKHGREELLERTAQLISEQAVIGWHQGRMEFGPRALGNRSIIADARNKENWQRVNLKIKYRESFRPFAPSVLEDKVGEYFAIDVPSPYMLLTAQVHDRIQQDPVKAIPAVTHVDGSARLQTVSRAQNALYYDLIKKFEEKTGCAVIINTSFNVRGEPIVCTPHDAYLCFMRTEMDYLVVGSFILDKKQMQPLREDINWRDVYQLD